jgi:hypothetical protein
MNKTIMTKSEEGSGFRFNNNNKTCREKRVSKDE